jgi:hypothetical protein
MNRQHETGYGYDAFGARRLRCDKCGMTGGVRKRTCPYRVLGDSLRGRRITLPYCVAPRLCSRCYSRLGGQDGLHGQRCRKAAADSQAHIDEIERQLDAGESFSTAAWGDWEPSVPDGKVGLLFSGRAGKTYRLMTEADYPNKQVALSAVASQPWEEFGCTTTPTATRT